MYSVCDLSLQILEYFPYLSAAKTYADRRKREYPEQVFFVCDNTGMIIAGY
jgi:hypothetical protein